jgi:hypothetical protein
MTRRHVPGGRKRPKVKIVHKSGGREAVSNLKKRQRAALEWWFRNRPDHTVRARVDITTRVINLIQADYQHRLLKAGIPADPVLRTPEQQGEAALNFWAVQMEVSFAVNMLLQTVVETN